MMPWINPLDRVPQIPQDWANHIAQGGLWSLLMVCLLCAAGLPIRSATLAACLVMATVAVLKKAVDFVKEGESLRVCVGKALVTVLWPLSMVVITRLMG